MFAKGLYEFTPSDFDPSGGSPFASSTGSPPFGSTPKGNNKTKKENENGIALIGLAATMVYLLVTSAGAPAARLLGKAAWYLPYAALVGSIRFFRAA